MRWISKMNQSREMNSKRTRAENAWTSLQSPQEWVLSSEAFGRGRYCKVRLKTPLSVYLARDCIPLQKRDFTPRYSTRRQHFLLGEWSKVMTTSLEPQLLFSKHFVKHQQDVKAASRDSVAYLRCKRRPRLLPDLVVCAMNLYGTFSPGDVAVSTNWQMLGAWSHPEDVCRCLHAQS